MHTDAVASRGDEMVAWAEARRGEPLRWWQWVSAQRRYEVRADGSWCWLLVFTSVPRQQGKSVELAEDASWSGSRGESRLILHAADRVTTSRDIQAALWEWAEREGLAVAKQLGDSRVSWPDGSIWKTIAMGSAYSRRPGRLLVDEAWDMDPATFWNAMFPALAGRPDPVQALFWSCANPGDRGLAADLRADGSVCRMEWGALDGEDHSDRGVWRASSAFWDPGREDLMAAAAGRPGFAENWLNVWPRPGGAGAARLLPDGLWDACGVPGVVLPSSRAVVGVSWDAVSGGYPVAVAGELPDGRVVVRLLGSGRSLGEAGALARSAAGRGAVLLVPAHPLRGQVRVQGLPRALHLQESDALSAMALAEPRLRAGLLVHDGSRELADAVGGVPAAREKRTWGAGMMALVCAWWAGKPRTVSAGA